MNLISHLYLIGLHIFEHGILKILMKRKRTVIMCCQHKDFLTRADLILNFGLDGQLEDKGTYLELKRSKPDLLKVGWNIMFGLMISKNLQNTCKH